jgi:hypothetical protein
MIFYWAGEYIAARLSQLPQLAAIALPDPAAALSRLRMIYVTIEDCAVCYGN